MLHGLAVLQHDEDKIPAHEAPETLGVLIVPLARYRYKVEDGKTLRDFDTRLQLDRPGFMFEAFEARDGIDVSRYLGEWNKNVRYLSAEGGHVGDEDKFYEINKVSKRRVLTELISLSRGF